MCALVSFLCEIWYMPDSTGTVELTALHSLQWLINLLAHPDYHKRAPQFSIFNICATISGLS